MGSVLLGFADETLDFVEAKDDDFDDHLADTHLQSGFFKFCNFFVYKDTVDKVIQNGFS